MARVDQKRVGMNVSVTPELARFVQERVETGMYSSASEVVREALRLLAEKERSGPPAEVNVSEWRELRAALLRGEQLLTDERAREIERLFKAGVEMARSRLRRELPDASQREIDKHVAQWLRHRAGEPTGTSAGGVFREVTGERRRRLLGE